MTGRPAQKKMFEEMVVFIYLYTARGHNHVYNQRPQVAIIDTIYAAICSINCVCGCMRVIAHTHTRAQTQ